jgi:hypothetical protein
VMVFLASGASSYMTGSELDAVGHRGCTQGAEIAAPEPRHGRTLKAVGARSGPRVAGVTTVNSVVFRKIS